MKFTKNYSAETERLKREIETADAVVIGAGAGLSTAAGFTYGGERLQKYFGDFVQKYGFRDMYSGGFYPFPTLEERWAYWSRYIYINRYMDVDNGTYKMLYELVKDKDYFVITTNVDHQFQKAGFDKKSCFIHKEITACGNAASIVILKPMIMKKQSEKCMNSKRICVSRPSLFPIVLSAASR